MENIYKMLKDVERLRQDVMREINEIGANDQTTKKTTVYPMAKIEPLMVEGYPVFRFGYEGCYPYL